MNLVAKAVELWVKANELRASQAKELESTAATLDQLAHKFAALAGTDYLTLVKQYPHITRHPEWYRKELIA